MEQKQPVKCEKCDREFSPEEAMEYPGKVHVYQGKVMCEDCLVDMGVSPDFFPPPAGLPAVRRLRCASSQ